MSVALRQVTLSLDLVHTQSLFSALALFVVIRFVADQRDCEIYGLQRVLILFSFVLQDSKLMKSLRRRIECNASLKHVYGPITIRSGNRSTKLNESAGICR